MRSFTSVVTLFLTVGGAECFVLNRPIAAYTESPSKRFALRRNDCIPSLEVEQESSSCVSIDDDMKKVKGALMGITMALSLAFFPQMSMAVSGGGLDYADLDISGQDFSNNSYKKKDFTQVIAKGTSFAKSNLQGCRFYKAYLVNADFTGADLTGASLEDTSMDDASLKDAVAVGSYFSKSILDVASVENADFTDAQFPLKAIPLLCDREDLKGTNPVTGADTRDSAMCP